MDIRRLSCWLQHETDPREFGWYLVSNKKLGEISASGYIMGIEIKNLIIWLLVLSFQTLDNLYMSFPATFLRGIPNTSFLLEDGSAATHLFHFEDEHRRNDGWTEQSICWDDAQNALELIFNQRKENGDFQFGTGAV